MSRLSCFRVQFVCNQGGNYGKYGLWGHLFLLFMDCMGAEDACIRYGQYFIINGVQEV